MPSRTRGLLLALLTATAPLVAACGGNDSPSGPSGSNPRVTSVSPSSGSTTGGNTVTITGTGFSSDATVTIGGVAATGVQVAGSTSITVTTPARTTAGQADVAVTTGGRTSTLTNGFSFVAPSGTNRAPVISTFQSVGPRANQPSGFADINETVQVLATVTDAETPTAQLTYEWTGPGTLTPAGASLTWVVPSSFSTGTPATATLSLTVTERFTEGGVTHRQSTSGSFPVRVHNSEKEILDLGEDFLLAFSDSSRPTDYVIRNFSTTCDGGRGRTAEAADVDRNRAQFIQNFAAARVTRRPPVTWAFVRRGCFPSGRFQPNTDACSAYGVYWEVTDRSTGRREIAEGIDYVSAVLENDRWLLCHSDFIGTVRNPLTGMTQSITW